MKINDRVIQFQILSMKLKWESSVDFQNEKVSVKKDGMEVTFDLKLLDFLNILYIQFKIEDRFKELREKVENNNKVKKSKRTSYIVYDEFLDVGDYDDEFEK